MNRTYRAVFAFLGGLILLELSVLVSVLACKLDVRLDW